MIPTTVRVTPSTSTSVPTTVGLCPKRSTQNGWLRMATEASPRYSPETKRRPIQGLFLPKNEESTLAIVRCPVASSTVTDNAV